MGAASFQNNEDKKIALEALEILGMKHLQEEIYALSGGQRLNHLEYLSNLANKQRYLLWMNR